MWLELNRSVRDLLTRANKEAAKTELYSVTYGIFVPASGSKNDYMSFGMGTAHE
jgi:hypothetical protein